MCKLRAFGACPWVLLTSSVTILALLIWEDSFTAGCWRVNGPSPDYSAANFYSVITGSSISGRGGFILKASARTPAITRRRVPALAFAFEHFRPRFEFCRRGRSSSTPLQSNKGRRNVGG